jgi:Uma2 family endonuclease
MVAAPRSKVRVEDYLERERSGSEKHVFWDGEVYAMAGALPAHNAIVANVLSELRALTRRGPCQPFASDLEVHVPLRNGFVYPDATVVCGDLTYFADTRDVITNPSVVVEVLSEGTEAFDRGEKAIGYRAIPSLRDLVFVSQAERYVEHYARRDDGAWVLREFRGGDAVTLEILGGTLRLDEIYLKVEIPGGQ